MKCIPEYRNIYKVYIFRIHVKCTPVHFSTSFSRRSKDISFDMKLALKGLKQPFLEKRLDPKNTGK